MTPARHRRVRRPLGIGFALCFVFCCIAPAAADDNEFFEKRIRPLLVENCHGCHGAKKQKANLRLDSRASILEGGDTGQAVAPGKPEDSLLVKAVRYGGELKMPPTGKLRDDQIADLTEWVRRGAPWAGLDAVQANATALAAGLLHPVASIPHSTLRTPHSAHWAFQPIRRSNVPAISNPSFAIRNPIDAFILAKLQEKGLAPASEADKPTLIRRVTFDLIGLPPTPAEIDAFVNDDSPRAYEKVVERLLASPHYGERWARHWLDLVRFAETTGHEFDGDIPDAWRCRDYVIRAFNDDLPYDRFLTEHIAGDLLAEPRRHPKERWNESVLATGFWYLGETKHSPVDVRQDQAERIDNQIDVFGKAFQALTLGCARCHDHKFDPIPTKDYYSLFGVMASSRLDRAFIDDSKPLQKAMAELQETQTRWAKLAATRLSRPTEQKQPSAESAKWREETELLDDFASPHFEGWFAGGYAFGDGPTPREAVIPASPYAVKVCAGLAHSGRISPKLQGVLRSRSFKIERDFILFRAAGNQSHINVIVDGLQFLRDPIYGGLTLKVDHGDSLRWVAMNLGMWKGQSAYVELIDDGDGYLAVDEVRFADRPDVPRDFSGGGDIVKLERPRDEQSEEASLRQRIAALENKLPRSRRTTAITDGNGQNEHLFIRGNHKSPGEEVPRRFLSSVPGGDRPLAGQGSGRLELAHRLTDASNPLTARVMVNRIWQHHFGEGIVRSPDDFGKQGQPPTHPELLDWLASEFVRQSWSIKQMHRLMVLSSTYRMASQGNKQADEADPQNRLLHRMPVQRLEAEAIRDAILAVSGRLDRTVEGPSVAPHLTPFMLGRGRPGSSGPLDGNGRRSIYLQVRRNFLNPLFLAFDYPTPFTTMGKRGVSNVPAQALTLMNNPFVMQQAERWAERVLADANKSPAARITGMYRTALGREPSTEELRDAVEFINVQSREYRGVDHPKAWSDFAHIVFNLKEFVFIK